MANHSNQNLINQAALVAMEYRIDLYEQNKIGLPQLAQDLFSTVGGMIEVSTDWHNKFMRHWSAIEEVNALNLDEGRHEPIPEHKEVLFKALDDLRVLIHHGL
jgi:hypothetical protein